MKQAVEPRGREDRCDGGVSVVPEAWRESWGGKEGILVAFSGGVDSAVVLAVARAVHQGRVLAVNLSSVFQAPEEAERARRVADELGVEYRQLEVDPLDDPEIRRNPPDRCYRCKKRLFGCLVELARAEGLRWVVDGSHADDEGEYRPGRRAREELGVRSPLAEVGWTKREVRELARSLGLSNWDQAPLACLASRIPYGEELTPARLQRVGRAEEVLRRAGFAVVRVRDHGVVARLELAPTELSRLLGDPLRASVVAELKSIGYRYVALDLEGYRLGAMDEVLAEHVKQQWKGPRPERRGGGGE